MKTIPISFTTSDSVAIHATLRKGSEPKEPGRCIIIAPGFAQHSETRTMLKISELISPLADVLCLDFRGTGKSEGRFHFGEKEYLDLTAAFLWAKSHYERVDFLGFSLGAYTSLRTACETQARPAHLYLVSCPSSINDIISQGCALKHSLSLISRPREVIKERNLNFRWGNPLARKPNAIEFAKLLVTPVSFLVGEKDRLVPPSMSRMIYNSIHETQKTWTELKKGRHAELMVFSDTEILKNWLRLA